MGGGRIESSQVEYNALAEQLSVMESCIREGRVKELDQKCIAAFHERIARLEGSDTLAIRLTTISAKIERAEKQNIVVGKPTPVSSYSKDNDPEYIKQGITWIAEDFPNYIPIAGDGHCFFRSIVTYMWMRYKQMSDIEKTSYSEFLDAKVAELKSDQLQQRYAKFKEIIAAIKANEKSVDEVIHDKFDSNIAVGFLRLLACEYNLQKVKRKKFEGEIRSRDTRPFDTVEEYVRAMTDLTVVDPGYADEAEVAALSKMLGINIRVLDVPTIGKKKEKMLYPSYSRYSADKTEDNVFVLRHQLHYVLLLPKR